MPVAESFSWSRAAHRQTSCCQILRRPLRCKPHHPQSWWPITELAAATRVGQSGSFPSFFRRYLPAGKAGNRLQCEALPGRTEARTHGEAGECPRAPQCKAVNFGPGLRCTGVTIVQRSSAKGGGSLQARRAASQAISEVMEPQDSVVAMALRAPQNRNKRVSTAAPLPPYCLGL